MSKLSADKIKPMFRAGIATGIILMASMTALSMVTASEVEDQEKAALKACERSVCEIVTQKTATGETLNCALAKTWVSKDIQEGAEQKSLTWDLGDARCSVDLSVPQAMLVDALTAPKYTLAVPKHKVTCVLKGEKDNTNISLALAPTIAFEGGEAKSASLGISEIDAPTLIQGAIYTAAKIEENFGLFEADMVKDVNKFIAKQCPKALGEKG